MSFCPYTSPPARPALPPQFVRLTLCFMAASAILLYLSGTVYADDLKEGTPSTRPSNPTEAGKILVRQLVDTERKYMKVLPGEDDPTCVKIVQAVRVDDLPDADAIDKLVTSYADAAKSVGAMEWPTSGVDERLLKSFMKWKTAYVEMLDAEAKSFRSDATTSRANAARKGIRADFEKKILGHAAVKGLSEAEIKEATANRNADLADANKAVDRAITDRKANRRQLDYKTTAFNDAMAEFLEGLPTPIAEDLKNYIKNDRFTPAIRSRGA